MGLFRKNKGKGAALGPSSSADETLSTEYPMLSTSSISAVKANPDLETLLRDLKSQNTALTSENAALQTELASLRGSGYSDKEKGGFAQQKENLVDDEPPEYSEATSSKAHTSAKVYSKLPTVAEMRNTVTYQHIKDDMIDDGNRMTEAGLQFLEKLRQRKKRDWSTKVDSFVKQTEGSEKKAEGELSLPEELGCLAEICDDKTRLLARFNPAHSNRCGSPTRERGLARTEEEWNDLWTDRKDKTKRRRATLSKRQDVIGLIEIAWDELSEAITKTQSHNTSTTSDNVYLDARTKFETTVYDNLNRFIDFSALYRGTFPYKPSRS